MTLRAAHLFSCLLLQPILALAQASAGGEPELAGRFEHLQQPEVGARIADLGELALGRARLDLAPGTTAYVLLAHGRRCGVLVDGSATLSYLVEDRFSVPVARRNLRHASLARVSEDAGKLRVEVALRGAAVWQWGGPATAAPGNDRHPLPGWLSQRLERMLGNDPARDLLRSDLNGDPGFAWGIFHASFDDFVLRFDPMPSSSLEVLGRLRSLPSEARAFAGWYVFEELVAQPVGRAWWQAPLFELASVDTDLTLISTGGDHARVTARTRLRSLRDGLRLIVLDLFDQTLDSSGRLQPYRLSRFTVDGAPVPYFRRSDELWIELPRPLARGDEILIDAEMEGALLSQPDGGSYWRLFGVPWYPSPGVGGQEWAQFRVTVEAADPFVPFASGTPTARERSPNGTRISTRLEGPMQSLAVGAGRYESIAVEHQGARVSVSTYVHPLEEEARRIAGIVIGMRSCMEHWLGTPYPFPDLQIVELNQWGWGQAPPGIIFVTQEAFLTPARAALDDNRQLMASWASRGINERIAHEVAHGWFPHVVKVVRPEENWLSESLADYTSAECLRRSLPDREMSRHLFDRQLSDWKFLTREAGRGASVYLAAHLTDSERDADTWRDLLYGKGPLVLHAVRRELARSAGSVEKGDRLFMDWIRSYVTNFKGRPGETRHLIGILNQMTGRDWQPWFERFLYGDETPEVD